MLWRVVPTVLCLCTTACAASVTRSVSHSSTSIVGAVGSTSDVRSGEAMTSGPLPHGALYTVAVDAQSLHGDSEARRALQARRRNSRPFRKPTGFTNVKPAASTVGAVPFARVTTTGSGFGPTTTMKVVAITAPSPGTGGASASSTPSGSNGGAKSPKSRDDLSTVRTLIIVVAVLATLLVIAITAAAILAMKL